MDVSLNLEDLFKENELKIEASWKTSQDNVAICVDKCIYYRKTSNLKGGKMVERYVCYNSKNNPGCFASLSLTDSIITKVNNVSYRGVLTEPLRRGHKLETCNHSEYQILNILEMEKILQRVKVENLSIPIIYDEQLVKLRTAGKTATDIAKILPTLESVKQTLYNAKWTRYPPLPKTLDELIFSLITRTQPFMQTLGAPVKRFLLFDGYEGNQRLTIFCSDLQLETLAGAKKIGIDGTFKASPSLYEQLYIFQCWVKGECLPCAFVLLSGKKKTTYHRMILEIKNACMSKSLVFRPDSIIVDFEIGAIGAFVLHFPSINVVGCFFHYGQCLYRKLVELGLKSQFSQDIKLKEWFATCVSLAFIPPNRVQYVFGEFILDEADLRNYPALEKFNDYMLETWVDDGALFPIEQWNQFTNLDERTNNNNEGYHRRFASKIGNVPHPNVWKFIETVQNEEFLVVDLKLARMNEEGYKRNSRRKCDIERDLTILRAKNKYLASNRTMDDEYELLSSTAKVVQVFDN